jgi:hypothetical protein
MAFSSPSAVLAYLPASGAPNPLNADAVDPTSTSSGLFGGFVLALQLNVDFSDANEIGGTAPYHLGDLLLRDLANTPTYSGQTVRSFVASANRSLGGEPTVELLDEITQLAFLISSALEGGAPTQWAQEHLVVPEPATAGLVLLGVAVVAFQGAGRPHLIPPSRRAG